MSDIRKQRQYNQHRSALSKWSTQAYTMSHIVDNFKLPCVVQCDRTECVVNWENFSFDMSQPLLVYSSRSIEKVYAQSLYVDDARDELTAMGPVIVIPFDYDGLFGVLENGNSKIQPYLKIERLAEANPESFLCTKAIQSIVPTEDSEGNVEYVERKLPSGVELRCGETVTGNMLHISLPNVYGYKERKKHKYLKCFDDKDTEILLDYNETGIFYELCDSDSTPKRNNSEVFLLKDLVNLFRLPINAQLVHGEMPTLMGSFTGWVALKSVFTENTVVASSLSTNASVMFEISLLSSAKYHIALNEPQSDFRYRNALAQCDLEFDNYVSRMKIAFTVQPEEKSGSYTDSSNTDTSNTDNSNSDTSNTNSYTESTDTVDSVEYSQFHSVNREIIKTHQKTLYQSGLAKCDKTRKPNIIGVRSICPT